MSKTYEFFRSLKERVYGFFRGPFGGPPTERLESRGIATPEPQAAEGVPAQRQVPRVVSTKPRVTIGVDFGTYSTKVLVHWGDEELDKAKLVRLAEPTQGYPSFVLPSDVRISGGRLYFGREAWSRETGDIYHGLKINLINCAAPLEVTGGNRQASQVPPEALVTAYFSWVLGLIRNQLDQTFGDRAYRPYFNFAAPMNHIEDEKRKQRYLRVVTVAWNSVFREGNPLAHQGSDAGVLDAIDLQLKAVAVPGIQERFFEVLPENLAPLVSLAQQPKMKRGMYLVVDMGAGTTELSINKFDSGKKGTPILTYWDKSVLLGARCYVNPNDVNPTIEKLLKESIYTWGKGFDKVKGNFGETQEWRNLNILLAGGGTQHPGVRPAFLRNAGQIFIPWAGDGKAEVETYQPEGIDYSGIDRDYFRRHSFLLAVAHGLTSDRQRWPQFVRPFEIKPAEPTPEPPKGYNWQDDPGS